MSVFDNLTINNVEYPFENKEPNPEQTNRLLVEELQYLIDKFSHIATLSEILQDRSNKDFLFPDIINDARKECFHHLRNKESWMETYIFLTIWCQDNYYDTCYLLSPDGEEIYVMDIFSINVDNHLRKPARWSEKIFTDFTIGLEIPYDEDLSLKERIAAFPPIFPYQTSLQEKSTVNIPKEDFSASELVNERKYSIYVHAAYTINLAKEGIYHSNILKRYLRISKGNNFKGVVVHVGKSTEFSVEDSISNMYSNIKNCLDSASKECPILLETAAHQGSELCWNWDGFFDIFKKIRTRSFRMCVDTCHVFAAGYCPYHFISEALEIDPRDNIIKLIHYNDSSYKSGERKDRHAAIGRGKIHWFVLVSIAKLAKERGINMVKEW